MLDEQDVYICFKDIQSQILNKHYRHPKNWDNHFNNKMKPIQREALRKMKRYLATIWSNINLESYFKCGFELYKTFSYHQFFNTQVLNLYIQKDKNYKRKSDNIKSDLVKSAKYIKSEMLKDKITTIQAYCDIKNGFRYKVVDDYLKCKVSTHLLAYFIYKKYLPRVVFNDDQIQEIFQKWNILRNEVIDNISFLDKIKEGIENMSVNYSKEAPLLTDKKPEGELLLGTETLIEKENEKKEYNDKLLVEDLKKKNILNEEVI